MDSYVHANVSEKHTASILRAENGDSMNNVIIIIIILTAVKALYKKPIKHVW